MDWTEEKIRALSVHDRHELWKNAKRLDAGGLVHLIETCGLPYSEEKNVRLDDPIGRKMEEIIFSKEGKEAALAATIKGMPAMAGVDPLLLRALGVDYGAHNEATVQAGFLVAQMMRMQGYKTSGRKGKLPPTCVAKTAEIYVPIK